MTSNKIYLSETEAYQLAGNVFGSICKDLNEGMYKEMGGRLSIAWKTDDSFNASAKILNKIDEPPNHLISFNYNIVKEFYNDVIHFHAFAENIHIQIPILTILNSIVEIPTIPECFIKKDSIHNMFMAGLTFIFFHELGHLLQQHGRIRAHYSDNSSKDFTIEECDINNINQLTDKQAAVSHTTELAADSSAITRCIVELVRQFSDEEFIGEDKDNKGTLFLGGIQLFVNAISCLFYRFRGVETKSNFETIPTGSHPEPLMRLQFNLPHIYEMLSFPIIDEIMQHNAGREGIVKIVSRAAYAGALFWLVRCRDSSLGIPKNYFFSSLLGSEESKKYIECIISTWDEIEPMIDDLNLDYLPFTKLSFTEELRADVNQ